jgi:hypothetical protein
MNFSRNELIKLRYRDIFHEGIMKKDYIKELISNSNYN